MSGQAGGKPSHTAQTNAVEVPGGWVGHPPTPLVRNRAPPARLLREVRFRTLQQPHDGVVVVTHSEFRVCGAIPEFLIVLGSLIQLATICTDSAHTRRH